MNPCQSATPLQTNPSNFQTYQQTNNQQSTQCSGCPGNSQGQYTQSPFSQFYQQESYLSGQYPCTTQPVTSSNNPCQRIPCQNPTYNVISPMQTQATNNCGPLPQNIIDQIRSCIANTTPIFIIPGGCQQPVVTAQQAASIPGILNPLTATSNQPSIVPNYISSPPSQPSHQICPPSFYPYPIPFPIFDSFGVNKKEQQKKNCGCSTRSSAEFTGLRLPPPISNSSNFYQEEEHRCTETIDDTICSKRNCPSAISLQALASQLLSIQGIVSCTATRLLLRKIPGSNITTSMEDTMERAQRSINVLNKDQLLVESRNSQQVNALINLHMTANPPANIIPILTLVQLKVNVLKAQIENLINRKLMENQGLEVEATNSIDPTILALKTDAELREFLAALKQKECDERVNLNYAPYRSQRVIAENRLNNVEKKIQQVELEFERRRRNVVPSIPISSRIVREFAETPCNFTNLGYPGLMSPTISERMEESRESPDPFAITVRSPKKLRLKPHVGSPEVTYDYSNKKPAQRESTRVEKSSQSESTRDKKRADCPNRETCTCYEESSSEEESLEEDKKKLQLKIDQRGNVTVTSAAKLKDVSFMKLASNVSLQTRKPNDVFEKRDRKVKREPSEIDSKDFREPSFLAVPKVEEISSEVSQIGEPSVKVDIDLMPDVKAYDTVSENERESFTGARLTLEEFKVDSDVLEDEKEEKKVLVSDAIITNGDNAKRKTANSKVHFKELTTLSDKEVQIPKIEYDKIIASIKEEPIEADNVETNAYTVKSEIEISTNNLKENLYSIEEEKIKVFKSKTPGKKITSYFDDIAKPETTDETERMIEAEIPKKTFVTTASIKIEPPEVDEPETDENTEDITARNSKILEELSEISKKTFLTTLKIDNSRKSEGEDETKGMLEIEKPKKTFVTTASIKIEPPEIDEPETTEYTEEITGRNSKIVDELTEKPKKTFLTTLKIGNSKKPKDERPKKTFISTASIKIEPPKVDEQERDEYNSQTTREISESTDEFWEKPKKTYLTTLKIGNSIKPEDERPKKTFISTASIKIEPPEVNEEEANEYTEEIMRKSSKIASEQLLEKPKKTYLTTLKVGSSTKPEVEGPKKTFISTASIKIEPPKVEERETDEYTEEETTAKGSQIADNNFVKPEKKFLTTLRIGNSIKNQVEDKKTNKTIDGEDTKKTYVSKAFIEIESDDQDDKQLESKIFKQNWKEMKINLINKKDNESVDNGVSKKVDTSEESSVGLYKSTINFLLEGTDKKGEDNSVSRNTVASMYIGKKEDQEKEKIMSTFLTDKGRNEKIVSMLTEIKYDEPEATAERFRSALTRNFQLDNDVIDRRCKAKYVGTEIGNYYCTMGLDCPESRCFPWKIDLKKHDNDVKQFNNQTVDAQSENTFLPEKNWIKPNTYDTDTNEFPFINSDRYTSKCHFESDKGLLSVVISLMSNQVASFGNAINKIATFGNILSGYDESETSKINLTPIKNTKSKSTNFEMVWTNPCEEYLTIIEDVKKLDEDGIENGHCTVTSNRNDKLKKKLNKKEERVITKDSLSILKKNDRNKLRDRLKHLIIKDKDNRKSYLIPENSFRGLVLQPYPKPNLGRPYKIRRNLLIRSRLKDNHKFKQNLFPLTIVKQKSREGNCKSFREISGEGKTKKTLGRVENVKNDENFRSLPLIKEKNSKISFTIEKSSTSKPIPNKSNTRTAITFFSTDSCVSTEESFTLETT